MLLNTLEKSDFFRPFREWSLMPFEEFGTQWSGYHPKVDVADDGGEIRITAELPGLDEKDVEVLLQNDVLTLKGEKKAEKEDKGKNFYRVERTYGSFERSISLPCEVDRKKVEASFKKGVLTVRMPKTEAAKDEVKRIPVKTA